MYISPFGAKIMYRSSSDKNVDTSLIKMLHRYKINKT